MSHSSMQGFQFPQSVFNPPQKEIDKILPLLNYDHKLRALGQTVFSHNSLYDLGDGRVVKTGIAASVDEARAMIFVRAHTNIPIPEVYMVFEHEGETYIVMELIDGVALREAMKYDADGEPTLGDGLVSDNQLYFIARQLQQIINELRDLGRRFSPNHPHFGRWPEGPYRCSYFYLAPPTKPFKSVDEFHAYFLEHMRLDVEKHPEHHLTYEHLEEATRDSIKGQPVLTHGDLAPRNLLVKGGRIVGVIDWEAFGWYPDFWEYMAMRNESLRQRHWKAIEDVFGKEPEVCNAYGYVTGCIY